MSKKIWRREDDQLVEILVNTSMRRNVAKTLVYLRDGIETTSVEIETSTALRQPEVSIAMQELRRRKWVIKRDIKKKGKGRPVHSYKLTIPFDRIVDAIEREEEKRTEMIKDNISQLREHLSR